MVAEWRTKLCTCSQCVQLYREKDIEFLLDPEDPNHVYEEANVENADGDGTSYEQGMSALSSLDRVQQVELIAGYNDMKENLVEYLRKFGSNKVIRAEDIQEFFTDLKNKRRKLSVPPSSCS
ncbi:hypothetical protein EB796_003502 [Bugula neritina]|uniref:E3 ubiquitin-protein ligase UBR7 n=1 Tax=Bugula neritina TaxID=10212 RepID=A0A7J7KHP5_BUGNE|nr:hypothetical protein EB796_003502 [Bugula neritina]